MDKPRILVVLASIRDGRVGEMVAKWIQGLAQERSDIVAELVDLKDWPLPLYAHAELPKKIENAYTDSLERAWSEKVGSADGFLFVTPEYNHGYTPALKNALDYLYTGWNHKPAAFVSYGGVAAGARAVEQLRSVAVELDMVPVRTAVHIPFVSRAFDQSGKPVSPATTVGAQNMLNQLAWWANSMAYARKNFPLPKPILAPKPLTP